EIKHRWMDHHLGILQQRVEAGAVGRNAALLEGERMRSEVQNRQEEDLNGGDDHGRISEKSLVSAMTQAQNESVAAEKQRQEKQRTFLPRPEHREFIRCGKIAIRVMVDVGDGKIVAEGGRNQNERSQ